MSIREISRRTGLARNTVKKYLRSDETEPSYERRVSSSKLDPYAEKLATWLGVEATKSRKQRRTLRQIHTLSPKRRKPRTYPHREQLLLTKSVGQYSMENSGQTSTQFNSMETQEGAALAAINVVQRFLHEREWKRIFEDTVVEESEGKVDHYLAAHWANEGRAGQGDQEPAAAAREKLEQWRQSS